MEYRILMEWDEQCGISAKQMWPVQDGVRDGFKGRNYGSSIRNIFVVLCCRARDFKQRKQYESEEKILEYDILLDFFPIKHMEMAEKKAFIRKQIVEISERTLAEYEFEDFNKELFLADLRQIVSTFSW